LVGCLGKKDKHLEKKRRKRRERAFRSGLHINERNGNIQEHTEKKYNQKRGLIKKEPQQGSPGEFLLQDGR